MLTSVTSYLKKISPQMNYDYIILSIFRSVSMFPLHFSELGLNFNNTVGVTSFIVLKYHLLEKKNLYSTILYFMFFCLFFNYLLSPVKKKEKEHQNSNSLPLVWLKRF